MVFFKIISRVLVFIVLTFWTGQTLAQQNVAERFSGSDPNSTVRVNHEPLSDYLEATVFPVGRSYRILGDEKPDTYRGSRIKVQKSLSPARFENSRIFIHAFTDAHKEFFRAYQEGLERLSNRRSLNTLNKNEQAAFWLNLYNVIVINKLVEEYPISSLKSLRSTKRGKKAFWDEKVTAIEGVPLSLTDIEEILFSNFNTPLVVFGLWQGAIGGPRLLNYAYTGKNVWRALENNALEFVNSNRGLRPPTGSRMNVSQFYEWAEPAFGTSEDHVLMFIKEYSDPNFIGDLSGVSTIRFKEYDWTIADILGGTRHTGTANQLGGVLGGGTGGLGGGNISPTPGAGEEATVSVPNIVGNFNYFLSTQPTGAIEGIPPVAVDLVMGIRQNTRRPIPVITSEECAPGEVCEVEDINLRGGDTESDEGGS